MKQRSVILIPCALTLILSSMAWASNPVVKVREATLAQQKQCSEQAERRTVEAAKQYGYELAWVKTENDNPSVWTVIEHTNHYDASSNVCYMTLYEIKMSSVQDEVFNAFENRRVAIFERTTGKDEVCRVFPRGGPELTCNSWLEYQGLIRKYFGIGN